MSGDGAHNEFAGSAENVAQAGSIGVVNFYGSRRPSAPVCQVPTVPAHYTNNERQLGQLDEWLSVRMGRADDQPRLAIVRGSPGSGTTTLVNYWVHQHRADFPDGQFFVRLNSGIDGPDRELPALKELLQATEHAADDIPDSAEGRAGAWRSWSTGKRIAMVVDDASTFRQVRALLPGAGASAVLVTEKGRLGGAHAAANARAVDMAPLSPESCRAILAAVAGAERAAAEPEAVDWLIGLCEGLPIAVSVIAALLAERPERPIAKLADRLRDDERLLARMSQYEDMSLTVVFDAAYHRLSGMAKRCYVALGAHPGTGHVATDALAAVLAEDAEDALAELAAARLVEEVREERYAMSGLIRAHARSHATDIEVIERRFLEYYVEVGLAAESLAAANRGWREQLWPDLAVKQAHGTAAAAVAWLEAEAENLFAVVRTGEVLGLADVVGKSAVALWPLHERGGHSQDMVEVNTVALRMARASGTHLHAAVFAFQCAFGYRQRGAFDLAIEQVTIGREEADRSGSDNAAASIVELFGLLRIDQDRPNEAVELLRRNVELAERIRHDRRLALARFHLAKVVAPGEAQELLALARAVFTGSGEEYNVAKIDLWLGLTAVRSGDLDHASAALERVRTTATERGWHRERAQATAALGDVASETGDVPAARQLLAEAEEVYRRHNMDADADATHARLANLD